MDGDKARVHMKIVEPGLKVLSSAAEYFDFVTEYETDCKYV